MTTVFVLLVLGTLLGVVLMQLFKKTPAPSTQPAGPDLANLKVTDARVGDVISVVGAGENLADLDFTIDRSTRYEAGAYRWLEVSGPYRERRAALRVAGDEELEVGLHSDPRKIALADLGLSEDDLAEMDQRQNPEDVFDFDGRDWLYRRSREVKAWRDHEPQPAAFYYWEFQERDGKRLLTVRKAEGEPFAVELYTAIPAGDVTVYRDARA
jgi:hypothetical protein